MVFLVSYDQRKAGKDYSALYQELKRLGAKRVQSSLWGIKSDLTAAELHDLLYPHFDKSRDRLLVIAVDLTTGYRGTGSRTKLADI